MKGRGDIEVTGPDGTVYPSRASAARALGVHRNTIRWHLKRFGDLSMVGMLYVRCIWRGQEYPTIAAVSKASGRSTSTIIHHLNRYGNLDRLGVGKAGICGNRSKSKPVRIGPYEWPSRTALAREMGVSPSTVSRCLSNSAPPHRRDRLLAWALQKSTGATAPPVRADDRRDFATHC